MKDLSVIIVSYKGWERLEKCLVSLKSFTGALFSSEVIVVDNGSDEYIKEVEQRYPGFRFIQNPVNGGFGNGCNLGSRIADGHFLLFLNPDTVVREDQIAELLTSSELYPDYYLTSCAQVNEKGKESKATGELPGFRNLTGIQRSLNRIFSTKKSGSDSNILLPDWVSGSVMMIRKDRFTALGGFDEDFWMYYEDVDICRRVHNLGGKIGFFRNITIEHNHGGSSRINTRTASITKTEVLISEHLYMSKSKSGIEELLIQIFLVINNLLPGAVMCLIGALLFFIPQIFVKTLIFGRLIAYYTGALLNLTWISPQSVNSPISGNKPD